MRAGYRQPIYLAKLKRRDNQNMVLQGHKRADSFEYDLMLFQESLQMHEQTNGLPASVRSSSLVRKPLLETTGLFNQAYNLQNCPFDVRKNVKEQQSGRTTAPVFEKCLFNKNSGQLKNIHKTQASIKPNTKTISQTFISFKGKSSVKQPSFVKVDPIKHIEHVEQSKLNATQNINIIEPLKQLKLVKFVQTEDIPNEMIRKDQQKIEELQEQKAKNFDHIKQLQQANAMHQRENQHLLKRIQHIQTQFDELINRQNSLETLEKSEQPARQIVALAFYSEQYVQTDPQPANSPNQPFSHRKTQASFSNSKNQASRASFELSSQDLLLSAKQLKNELQLQKIHSANLQTTFKITLQNKQIQWRQKVDLMQRQIQSMNKRYESKCSEVKQKDQLISRLIQK